MRRGFWFTFLLVLLGAGFLFLAGTRLDTISQLRRDYALEPSDPFRDDEVLSDLRLPTVALFTFRSLLIDYLWIRADKLMNDGQYFDALHLARAICVLQPNLPSVWVFNAWNMAYNISVAMPTGQERWHWVQAGYKLLRDEAIPYNRRSPKLYQELARIFQHKIGGITDEWNREYKLAMAVELGPLIGNNDIAAYEELAESPRRWDEPSCPAFNADRLADVQELVLNFRDGEGGVSGYLRERFSSRTKRLLAEYKAVSPPSKALTDAVVLELNKVLVGDPVYEESRFKGVALSKETRALLAKNRQGFDAIWLNWRLLSEAYPKEIKAYEGYRLDRDEGVLELIDKVIKAEPKFESREDVVAGWNAIKVRPRDFSPDLFQVLADHQGTRAFRRLDAFARSQVFRQEWKLEPHWMVLINQEYGPVDYNDWDNHLSLDWRSAFSHSLYWAMRGLQFVEEGEQSSDELSLRRYLYFSLQDLRHYGRMQIYHFAVMPPQREPGQEVLTAKPVLQPRLFLSQDLRMFPVAYQETLDIIQGYIDAGKNPPAGVVDGSENLALSGITDLYLANYPKMARAYWDDLCERYPEEPRYTQSMESFVRGRLQEQIADIDPKTASNVINSLLRDFYSQYAISDDDTASQMEEFARQVHQRYSSEFDGEETDRVIMPSFSQLSWIALVDFMKDAGRDPALKSLLTARLKVEKPEQYEKVMVALKQEGISGDGSSWGP